jgi:hypothetical protein
VALDRAVAPGQRQGGPQLGTLAPQPGGERDQVWDAGAGRGREPPVEPVGQPPRDDLHELLEQRVGRRHRRAGRL